METDRVDPAGVRKRPSVALWLVPTLAFVAGLAAMGWLLANWSSAAGWLGIGEPAPAPQTVIVPPQPQPRPMARPAPVPQAPTAATEAEPERLVIDPETIRRVSQLEQRVAAIDTQSRAAIGNADRAEGLLVAFATRRALDRGVALGFLENLLRQRFGDSQRAAVATVITASRTPVTLEELQDGLIEAGPDLLGVGQTQSAWDAFRAELGQLISVRKAGTPSTIPAERLRRATRSLEAGQVDVALAEVLRMPGRESARDWVLDARRYVAARRALDTIETAALLEPRRAAIAPAQPAAALPPPAP